MKLWYLEPVTEGPYGDLVEGSPHRIYDCYRYKIVRAETEAEARQLASVNPGDEGTKFWLNPQWSTCEEYVFPTAEGEPSVIWSEFTLG